MLKNTIQVGVDCKYYKIISQNTTIIVLIGSLLTLYIQLYTYIVFEAHREP